MLNKEQLNDPALQKLVIQVSAKQILFRQGEKGRTMYIIIDGLLRLVQNVGRFEQTIEVLGRGEVIGERAVCVSNPYKRLYTVKAETASTLLECDSSALKTIQAKLPDFPLTLLALVSSRLERMGGLVSVLQIPKAVERVVHYIAHRSSINAGKTPNGIAIELSAGDISDSIGVDQSTVDEVLEELSIEQLIIRQSNLIVIPDQHALLAAAHSIDERLAA